jgi:hypothetical protein
VQRSGPVIATLVVLALVACNPIAGFGVTVHRENNQLSIVVPGYRDPDTQGYLCPVDPGDGPVRGEDGRGRLFRAGCLDLGVTATIDPDATGWSAVINLESLASAQLEAFSNRATYRLVLVSGDVDGGRTFSTDIAAVDKVP